MQIDSIPRANLIAAVNDMNAVISCSDRLAASGPGNGSRAAVGDDLAALTQSRLQARAVIQASSPDSSNLSSAKRRRRHMDSMAVSTISRDGTLLNSLLHRPFDAAQLRTNNMVSHIKNPRIEVTTSLEEEITEVNSRLIDTVVEVSAEGTEDAAAAGLEGVVVACYFKGDAVSPNVSFLQTQEYSMVQMAPLFLIVPPTYPESSPTVWPDQTSANTK
jgi:PAX-interacting protein 1